MTARRRYDPEVLAETVRVIIESHGQRPHGVTVADHFGISLTVARYQINAARYAGLLFPSDLSKWRNYRPTRLVCDCGESVPVDAGVPGLQRHTLIVHGRNPSAAERTPRVLVAA